MWLKRFFSHSRGKGVANFGIAGRRFIPTLIASRLIRNALRIGCPAV